MSKVEAPHQLLQLCVAGLQQNDDDQVGQLLEGTDDGGWDSVEVVVDSPSVTEVDVLHVVGQIDG